MFTKLLRMLVGVLVVGAMAPASALAAYGSFSGTVTSATTGADLGGITANLYSDPNSPPISTQHTAPNGSYGSGELSDGTYYIQFDGTSQGYNQTGLTKVVVSGGTATPATVNGALTPDSVTGTVVNQRDQPGISGVTVALVNTSSQQVATTTSGQGGAFSFSAVPQGRIHRAGEPAGQHALQRRHLLRSSRRWAVRRSRTSRCRSPPTQFPEPPTI